MQLAIDVRDWLDEYMAAEPDVTSEDAALATQTRENRSALQMGRLLIVGREKGDAPGDIIPENKVLLNTGASYTWMQRIAQRMSTAKLGDRDIQVREVVGTVPEEGGDEEPDNGSFVRYDTPEAVERALGYLCRIVPGHVYNRLVIIAVNGGDVRGAADELKDTIDEMVTRLTEPVVM